MLTIDSFSKKELIKAILNWLNDPEVHEEITVLDIYNALESGSWLEYYDNKLDERPHYNS